MKINQTQYKANKKRSIKTKPDQFQQNPQLRNSLGQQAKQQLRQISHKYEMESDIIRQLQWSSKPKQKYSNNISQQGFFQINLSKINTKIGKAQRKAYKMGRQSQHQALQQRNVLQPQNQLLGFNKRRRKSQIYTSINYELLSSRYKQSRIHSISQNNMQSNNSHFIVNEEVFKEAAAKLQKKHHFARLPLNLEPQKQDRVQSQLIVRRKVQKSPQNEAENPSLNKINYISISPHNLPSNKFAFTPPIYPIKKKKVNFPIKITFNHRSKHIT